MNSKNPNSALWLQCLAAIVFALPAVPFVMSLFARQTWLLELLNNFQWQIFIGLLGSTCLLVLMKRWRWVLVILVLLAFSSYRTYAIYLPASLAFESRARNEPRFKLLAYNLLYSNESFEAFLDEVDRTQPDILVLSEFSPRWQVHLESLKQNYPYHVLQARKLGSGIAVYSREKIDNDKVFALTPEMHDCPMICCRIVRGDQSFFLFGVHTLSPREPDYLDIRNLQFNELADIINSYPGEKVVVGDFNATTWSPYMRTFLDTTKLLDSRQGRGLMSTWPTQHWLLRIPIDHAFHTPGISIQNRKVHRDLGSDHLPIIVEFSVQAGRDDAR